MSRVEDPPAPAGVPEVGFAPRSVLKNKHYCPECKRDDPDVVEDFSAGDIICRDCGTVVGDRIIDVHSEWRTFANDTSSHDPNRVGGPSNPLLNDAGLSTIISKAGPGGNKEQSSNLSRWQNRTGLNSSDRNLLAAFKEISRMAERIGLPQTIKDRANLLFKQIEDGKTMRGRSSEGIIAACIYIACRLERVPRTFKEICALTSVPKKEIGRCYKFMFRTLKLETNLDTISTSDFMNRWCSLLDLPMDVQKAATHVAHEAVQLGVVAGKCPVSVAAAGIYLVSQLSSARRSQKEISEIAGVSEVTIKSCFKDLYPHRHKLLPETFVPAVDVNTFNPES